jgi:hypothetical protein
LHVRLGYRTSARAKPPAHAAPPASFDDEPADGTAELERAVSVS